MTLEEMQKKVSEFLQLGKHWRDEMAQWVRLEPDKKSDRGKEGAEGLKLLLYTDRHSYSIVMRPEFNGRKSYLGCVMSNRAPWPGETHTRGGDLADGDFNEETLRRIWSDILSKELHPVIVQPEVWETVEEVTGPSIEE